MRDVEAQTGCDSARGFKKLQRFLGRLPYRASDTARDLESNAPVFARECQHCLDSAIEVHLPLGHAERFTHAGCRDTIDPLTAVDHPDTESAIVRGHVLDA